MTRLNDPCKIEFENRSPDYEGMAKTHKIRLAVAGVLGLGILGYGIWHEAQKSDTQDNAGSDIQISAEPVTAWER